MTVTQAKEKARKPEPKVSTTPVEEDLLDDALADTFPASDPVVMQQPVTAAPAPPPEVAADVKAEEREQRQDLAKSEAKKAKPKH